MTMKKPTSDGVEIIHRLLDEDPELKALYEEERQKLEIADKIKAARIRAGLSQSQLAERIASSQPAIARIENSNYRGHSFNLVFKIAQALNQDIVFDFKPR